MTVFILTETCEKCGERLSAMFLRDDPDDFHSKGVWVTECPERCTVVVDE